VDLEITEVGSGDALVVLVHGVLDRGRSFRHMATLLEGECRLRWYDRRGYGDSIGLAGEPADIRAHAADALAVFDGEAGVLVGHSFGGVVAMAAAATGSDLVQSVGAFESALPWAPGWDDTVMRTMLGSADTVAAALRLILGERLESLGDDVRARREQEAVAFIAEERSARLPEPPFDVADIRVPLLYATGGLPVMQTIADFLLERVPSAEVTTMPGADHHAHRTDPERFAALVRRTLDRRPGAEF
jgi:pimeloyl-ACP methyl ester carboxylesterase